MSTPLLPSTRQIPVDVLAEIVKFVGHRGLKQCSLASRDLVSLCRPYLFSRKSFRSPTFMRDLIFVSWEAPHLSSFVRDLSLHIHLSEESEVDMDVLEFCFESFTQVRTLYLTGAKSWASLPRFLRVGIRDLLSMPMLRSLHLFGWTQNFQDLRDLKHMLSACSQTLRELTLEAVGISGWISGQSPPEEHSDELELLENVSKEPVRMLALETLTLYTVHDAIRVQPFMDCPKLEHLTADLALQRRQWTYPVFVSSSLKSLHIAAAPRDQVPDLRNGTQLLTLEISMSPDGSGLSPATFNWAKGAIDTLPFPLTLRRVILDIFLEFETPPVNLEPSHCHDLAETFSRLHSDGQLESAEVRITICCNEPVDAPEMDSHLAMDYQAKQLIPMLQAGFGKLVDDGIVKTVTNWKSQSFEAVTSEELPFLL